MSCRDGNQLGSIFEIVPNFDSKRSQRLRERPFAKHRLHRSGPVLPVQFLVAGQVTKVILVRGMGKWFFFGHRSQLNITGHQEI